MRRGGRGFRFPAGLLLALLLAGPALAADRRSCREIGQRIDALGQAAMREELALSRRYREQLCPELSRRAEAANAIEERFAPIDYQALRDCRQRAEELLAEERPVLHRNLLAFPFFTSAGAALARQADGLRQRRRRLDCPVAE